jgi:hypothetical protein
MDYSSYIIGIVLHVILVLIDDLKERVDNYLSMMLDYQCHESKKDLKSQFYEGYLDRIVGVSNSQKVEQFNVTRALDVKHDNSRASNMCKYCLAMKIPIQKQEKLKSLRKTHLTMSMRARAKRSLPS